MIQMDEGFAPSRPVLYVNVQWGMVGMCARFPDFDLGRESVLGLPLLGAFGVTVALPG